MSKPENKPDTPYYAVIFTSVRTDGDNGYSEAAARMLELAKGQPGFLGVESARNEVGITVSYWQSLDAIVAWKKNAEHLEAQKKALLWYRYFHVRVAKVEREHEFGK